MTTLPQHTNDTDNGAHIATDSATLEASVIIEAHVFTLEEAIEAVKNRFYTLYRSINFLSPLAVSRFDNASDTQRAEILDNDLGFTLCSVVVAKDLEWQWAGFTRLMAHIEAELKAMAEGQEKVNLSLFTRALLLTIGYAPQKVLSVLRNTSPNEALTRFLNG